MSKGKVLNILSQLEDKYESEKNAEMLLETRQALNWVRKSVSKGSAQKEYSRGFRDGEINEACSEFIRKVLNETKK